MERIVCLLIFCLGLSAQEFIFWAEFSNKNLVLFYQNYHISPAMTQSQNTRSEFACELFYNESDVRNLPRTDLGFVDEKMPKTTKLNFLNSHQDELFNCFINAKVKVQDLVKSENALGENETYIKILPLRFSVEFGQNSALIYYLYQEK